MNRLKVFNVVLIASSVLSAMPSHAQITIDLLGIYQTGTLCENNPSLRRDMPGFCEGQHYSGYFKGVPPTAGQGIRSNSTGVPHSSEALDQEGLRLLKQRKYQAAITTFDRVIALNSADVIAYAMRGLARTELRDYQGAWADGNRAIQIDRNYAYGYGVRGLARLELQDVQGALEDANQAIRINPNAKWAYELQKNARSRI